MPYRMGDAFEAGGSSVDWLRTQGKARALADEGVRGCNRRRCSAPPRRTIPDTGAGESIAYSVNGGETFKLYEGNPVIEHKGRDPKPIWYPASPEGSAGAGEPGHWVCAVYDEDPELGRRFMVAYLKGVRAYNEGKTDENVSACM